MKENENVIDIRRIMRAAQKVKWLLIAIVISFTALGAWHGFTRLPKYDINGEVLIGDNNSDKDASAGSVSQMMKTFSVGGFSGTGVDNELMIMGSYDVMLRTVRNLNLNRIYIAKNKKGKKEMLYQNLPLLFEAPAEQFDTLSTAFNVNIKFKEDNKVDLTITKGLLKSKEFEANDLTLPTMIKTPFGNYQLVPTESYDKKEFEQLTVAVMGNAIAADALLKEAKIDIPSKLADVIDVDYTCSNEDLGKAIVNGIMGEYNSKRRERLHEASQASIDYYDERIAETFEQLEKSEKEVRDYQKKNELMGMDSELGILVGDAYGSRRSIRSTHYNLAYYETVLDILRNRLNDDVIIPAVENIGDPNIEAFNAAIHARRDLRRSATEDNEVLIRLNEKIAELRDIIIENSEKQLAKYKKDLAHTESLAAIAETRLDSLPEYQHELRNITREKSHLNSLYEYLVGQRENAVLQRYSTANIGFVFQEAYVAKGDSTLRRLLWPIGMFIFSIFACICLVIFISFCQRRIKDPMDLAKIAIDRHAVKFDGSNNSIQRLRNMIVSEPEHRVIYYSAFNDTEDVRKKFVDSLLSIGRSVELLTGFSTNDEILTPDTMRLIDENLENADYVVVEIAQPDQIFDLENAIDKENAVLVTSLKTGKFTRAQFKKIMKGQTADKVFTIISK